VGFAPAGRPGEYQHVEAGRVAEQVTTAEEVEGGVGELALLAVIDRLGGAAAVLVLGRAHLDEDDGAAVEGDEVDLAIRGVDVPGDDAEAGAAQVAPGGTLGPRAEPATPPRLARRTLRHAIASEEHCRERPPCRSGVAPAGRTHSPEGRRRNGTEAV